MRERLINITFRNFHTRKHYKKVKRQAEDISKSMKVTNVSVWSFLSFPTNQ